MSKPQLFMFHFAGGSSYSFKFLEPYLKEFNIEMIELPGRGMRTDEDLITDFSLAGEDLCRQVKFRIKSNNFLIYGHSMGALLGFKVTKMLELDNFKPICLITTGNPGPKIKENTKRYLLEDSDFLIEIKKLGGIPQEVLDNKDLLDYFIPILKADFQISEENNLDIDSKIFTPIYSLMGNNEKYCNEISNWENYTYSKFNYDILIGNHFFIFDHAEKLGRLVTKYYIESIERK